MAGLLDNIGKYGIKGGAIALFIVYITLLFHLLGKDDNSLSGKHVGAYLFGILFPLFVFSYFLFGSMKDPKYLKILGVMFIIIIFVFLRSWNTSFGFFSFLTEVTPLPMLSPEYSFLVSIFFKLLVLLIIIVGLSIVYNVFLNEGYRQQGRVGFILYLLFYIPCLISDYFSYLFQELKTTPRPVYALIALEILMILVYVFVPKLLNRIHAPGQTIVTDPIYFYHKQFIRDITPFAMQNKDTYGQKVDDKNNMKIRREYSISMWITTNNPTFGREECMMFQFGNGDETKKSGCPYISCTKEGKWKFVVTNNKEAPSITELFVPMQRWNNVVLNYHENDVDIVINGKLAETIHMEHSSLPIYDNNMGIYVGSDSNELHGAICNITIYPHILSLTQISQSYNILRLRNPPVNNLT